ncbi:MAG: LamG-like jellyroll fold domain-containing protein, partial [Candidatus Thalassarchaeaceae archaeon]
YLPFSDSTALGLDTHASATAAQAYTEFQCNFDGSDGATSATDASRNSATITFGGNAQLDTAQQKFGTASLLLDGTGDYVSIPDASYLEIGTKDFTIDCWVRFSTVPTDQETIVSKWTGTGNQRSFNFAFEGSTSNLIIQLSGDGSSTALNKQESWSPSQDTWYHVAVERTGGNVHLYVNGTQLGSGTANSTNIYNGSATFMVGALNAGAAQNFTGHLDEVRFINGYGAYQGSNFTAPTTAYATPPVSNTFTPYGSPTQTSDTPTNVFATLTPIWKGSNVTLAGGNLSYDTSTNFQAAVASMGVTSGKWYWEVDVGSTVSAGEIGFTDELGLQNILSVTDHFDNHGWSFETNTGNTYDHTTSSVAYGSAASSNDVIGVAIDLDNGKSYWSINGTWQNSGDPAAQTNPAHTNLPTDGTMIVPGLATTAAATAHVVNFGSQSPNSGGNADGNGYGDFDYAPPTGFLAICTANLYTNAAPAIEDGTAYFQATLYTGDGADGNEVNQSGNSTFQPDFLWVKSRSSGSSHCLFDAVRGASQRVFSNLTNAEATSTEYLASFDADGFTMNDNSPIGVGDTNVNTTTYVGWQWKGDGTSGSTNTDGSITSTVNANDTAGFSIVKWTGTGANGTIGHGMSAAPDLIIGRNYQDAGNRWNVYHSSNTSAPETDYLVLNTTAATVDDATVWNDTAPTASVFSVGTTGHINQSSKTSVAYCFRAIPGYSAFGSYEGNNSSDGAMLLFDFSPAYIMFKNIDASAQWAIYDNQRDPYNAADKMLFADSSGSENVGNAINWLSNGVKIRGNSAAYNASNTYVYAAFAEHPFAGSSPATAR